MGNLQILMADTLTQLQKPIQDYYDVIDKLDADPEAWAPFRKVRIAAARATASFQFRRVLARSIDSTALLAAGDALTGAQRAEVVYLKNEQDQYAAGFMDALGTITRDAALARAASYLPAMLHLYSSLQTHDMPTLPIEPGDGQTTCGHWCKCTLDIRKNDQDFDVYWTLHPAEHCEDCLKMASLWKPLRIRNGVIIDKYDYSFLSNKMRKMVVRMLQQLIEENRDALPS